MRPARREQVGRVTWRSTLSEFDDVVHAVSDDAALNAVTKTVLAARVVV